jgi:hypothetical protein
MLLARICEGIEALAWVEAAKGAKTRPKRPQRIERPGVKTERRKVGRAPIPINDFDNWYYGGD